MKGKMTSVVTTGLSQGDFDTLRVLKDGLMQDILTIITAMVAGGGGSGITSLTPAGGGIAISGSGATRVLTVDFSALATNTALGLKQNSIVAGTGITLSGNTISFDGTQY